MSQPKGDTDDSGETLTNEHKTTQLWAVLIFVEVVSIMRGLRNNTDVLMSLADLRSECLEETKICSAATETENAMKRGLQ